MTRLEFIQSLRKELRKLPPEEIVAATEFYEEYFDDALEALDTTGMTEEEAQRLREDTEARMIDEIGSPKAAAKQIRSEYAARILEGETPASGKKVPVGHKISAVWWVIIGICSAPVSIPLAIAIGCAAFGIITSALSIMISIYVGIIACAIAGIGFVIAGCAAIPATVSTAAMFVGIGLIAMAAAAAAGVGAFIGTRELIKWLARLAHNINEKRKLKKLNKMTGGEEYERA